MLSPCLLTLALLAASPAVAYSSLTPAPNVPPDDSTRALAAPITPGIARPHCGESAVQVLARLKSSPTAAPPVPTPPGTPPECPLSLADLVQLGAAWGLDLVPVEFSVGGDRPEAPWIIHWQAGHFSAVIARRHGSWLLDDPALGGRSWYSDRELASLGSGLALVPSTGVGPGCRVLAWDEACAAVGGLLDKNPLPFDDNDENCPTDEELSNHPYDPDAAAPGELEACPGPEECPPGADDEDCGDYGMPVWRVSEPYINLWIKDTPLFYTMSDGRIMPLILRFKQRSAATSTNVFGFGNGWTGSWLSYFDVRSDGSVVFLVPGGGKRKYSGALNGEMIGSHCERATGTLQGNGSVTWNLNYRSGCANLYTNSLPGTETNRLTLISEKQDAHGRRIRFQYETNQSLIRLKRVIDYDGRVSTLAYGNELFPRLVTSVTDPHGRIAQFQYDTNANLVAIVDVAGITNRFEYATNGVLTAMLTPYGRTGFRSWNNDAGNPLFPIARSIEVTLPNGDRQVYAYHQDLTTSQVPDYLADQPRVDEEVPLPVASGPLNHRSSFFWNSRQLALITNAWPSFEPWHYQLARWRFWDMRTDLPGPALGTRLRLERAPSPDGTANGHRTWYTYFADPIWDIPTTLVSQRAERLPDGTARYTWWDRNLWGRPTYIETSVDEVGTRGRRQSWYSYDFSGCHVSECYGPELDASGQPLLTRAYAYNDRNQVTNFVNVYGEITSATYHPTNANLTGITHPFGLRVTNVLNSDGFLARRIWLTSTGTPLATNAFVWSGDRVGSATDARGLIVANYWDALGRLTGRAYPDGTTISNWYSRMDGASYPQGTGGIQLLNRTRHQDRMGNRTSFAFDALRRLTGVTNALGAVRRFSWCNCGALESTTDPTGATTSCEHDLQGRLKEIHYPGGHAIQFSRDALGQATAITDGRNTLAFGFNHQGRCTNLITSTGRRYVIAYDRLDRITSVRLPTGAGFDYEYDLLGRLVRRTEQQSASSLTLGYTPGLPWPTSQTNRNGAAVTLLSYDVLGRIVREIRGAANAGALTALATNRFTYSPAGDLVGFTDALNHSTAWQYDTAGRAQKKLNAAAQLVWTNAYDALGHVTAHWTPARSNLTRYAYDAAGRLILVDFSNPGTTDIRFGYDDAGRLTVMADATGATRFTWNAFGLLETEDGPWTDDTVSFAHDSKMALRSRSLQQPDGTAWAETFAYDLDGRLTNLVSPAGSFDYTYRGGQSLITGLSRRGGDAVANIYDDAGQWLSTTIANANGQLERFEYTYDAMGDRVRRRSDAGNVMDYSYDSFGQLAGAIGREPDGTARKHEQFGYAHDLTGNLLRRQNGSTVMTLTPDSLNQLSSASRSATVVVAGLASPAATNVTVNGLNTTLYADHSFTLPSLTLAETNTTITAIARDALGRTDTDAINLNLSLTTRFTYDANGNLLGDGRRQFSYDDRNQLVAVVVTNSPTESSLSEFVYDGLGRRRIRRESTWQSDRWVFSSETRSVYAGALVLQERSADNLPTLTFTRGLDRSGTLAEAGGIGGLLAITRHLDRQLEHAYVHDDTLGNVTLLTDAAGNPVARYQYDPFGQLQGAVGPLAATNLLRFASKEFHPASGLYYFGFRYYDPSLQRWLNADPWEESGDGNLFRYAANNPIKGADPFGLSVYYYEPGVFPWLPGPFPYTYGDTYFDNYISAPLMNISATLWNGSYWVGRAAEAALTTYQDLIEWAEDKIGAPGLTEAIPLGLAGPKLAGKIGAATRKCAKKMIRVVRYVGPHEAKAAETKKCIPNVNKDGDPKFVYVTRDRPITTGKWAEKKYRIGKLNPVGPTDTPTHALLGNAAGVEFTSGGNVEGGSGTELITMEPIPLISITPLKP